jgi:tetratricopeptide (TPR) repeat protein
MLLEVAGRRRRLRDDLAVLKALDAVDRFRWTLLEGKLPDWAAVAARFRQALRGFGLRPGSMAAEQAAARLSRSAVRDRLVTALDWWLAAKALPRLRAVRAVLRAADPNPYRDAVRDAVLANHRARLAKLAGRPQAAQQPPGFAAWLGEISPLPSERRRELLAVAVRQRPGDLGLLMALGLTYPVNAKDGAREALRWYQAAVGVAPAHPAAWNNLAGALVGKGKLEEAIACLRKAIALDRQYAVAHVNLGVALVGKGKVARAIACYQKAIEIDPKLAMAHNNLGGALYSKGKMDAAIACLRKAIALDRQYAVAHNNLGLALKDKGKVDAAIACYKKALALDPKDAPTHYNLGDALYGKGKVDAAIACYHKALALDPKSALAHNNLGVALKAMGKFEEAIKCYHKALALNPKSARAHNNLGAALKAKGKVDRAIACFHKALALNPKLALAHNNLGQALQAKGKFEEAIKSYHKALALDPKYVNAHYNLGAILCDVKHEYDGAVACFKKALALNPKDKEAHVGLGNALKKKGRLDAAIACYQKAIALNPKCPAYNNLGNALKAKGRLDEAIASYHKAIALEPKNALAHFNLADALYRKGRLDAAIASLRKAIALDPNYAEAHCNLGQILRDQGRFAESLAAYQHGHRLGRKRSGWSYPSAQWVRQAQRLAELEAKLPAFLKGEFQPRDTTQRLALAQVCQAKKLHHATSRLFAAAFVADPKLADFLPAQHRYHAACAAALAAAGRGKDAAKLDAKQRARLRRQALAWLRADLALYAKLTASGPTAARSFVRQALKHWQQDKDLAGIRDKAALAKLPAEEHSACERLWADVAALLKKAALGKEP